MLPKSVTNERILSEQSIYCYTLLLLIILSDNAKIIDLTPEEINELHDIDKTHHFRACHPSWTGFGGLGFPDCK